jgi:protein-tyrosine phosphatase
MVCTGNTCRSPIAEATLRRAVGHELDSSFARSDARVFAQQVDISSAGTLANEGATMSQEALSECGRLGLDGGAHLAHRLNGADIRDADLVLGMTREYCRGVIALEPHAGTKTFTLTEFVRILRSPGVLVGQYSFDGEDLAGLMRSVVAIAAASRAFVPALAPEDWDIDDPYGRGHQSYARVTANIDHATAALASTLVGAMRDR